MYKQILIDCQGPTRLRRCFRSVWRAVGSGVAGVRVQSQMCNVPPIFTRRTSASSGTGTALISEPQTVCTSPCWHCHCYSHAGAGVKIVQLVTMTLFTLVAGVFWGTWFSLSRSIASITPAAFLEIGHTMIANLGGPMSLLIPATIVSMLVLIVVLYRRHHRGRVRVGRGRPGASGRIDGNYAVGQCAHRRAYRRVDGRDSAGRLGADPESVGVLPWVAHGADPGGRGLSVCQRVVDSPRATGYAESGAPRGLA